MGALNQADGRIEIRGRHDVAFGKYEELLRAYIEMKQRGAERFAGVFAPRTRWGLFFRNQVIKAFAIPGLARLAFGRDLIDTLQLPDYRWPALGPTGNWIGNPARIEPFEAGFTGMFPVGFASSG